MRIKWSKGYAIFWWLNLILMIIIAFSCAVPLLNVLAMSFSDAAYVSTGQVKLWPRGFTLEAYKIVVTDKWFWRSLIISLKRLIIGVPLNMLLTVLAAFPLAKSEKNFKARKYYVWYFVGTMVFSGGLIPTYVVVSKLGLINSIWALILPGAVPVFNVILLMNFFRYIPKEIEEAALIDGAGQLSILVRLYLPLSLPALATITLFCIVGHWNAWFDGLIYMNDPSGYPLQSYLQTLVTSMSITRIQITNVQELLELTKVNDSNLRAAEVFVSMIPILLVYPYLQRYFTVGIVLGSVKD